MKWMLLALAVQASAAEKSVSVTGNCSREVAPDRASVLLTSESRENGASEAAEKATKLYEKLRAEVKKMKLADLKLQTAQYSVQPIIEYDSGRPKRKGFVAQMGLEVETSEISRMGDVIALATKLGIQNAGGLNTFLSVAKSRGEMESCLEDAVKNARMKADRMAKAGGASIGEVLTLEEYKLVPAEGPRPMAGAVYAMDAMSKSSPPGVEAKAQGLSVTVYVKYSLK